MDDLEGRYVTTRILRGDDDSVTLLFVLMVDVCMVEDFFACSSSVVYYENETIHDCQSFQSKERATKHC